jgi:hypothetical protein
VIRSGSFEEAFKARTWQHVDDPSLFYNFPAPDPDGESFADHRALAPETTLGEIRGKIVLLRRFEATREVGSDFTNWPKNQHFRCNATLTYDVEDCYLNPGEDNKYDCIIAHMDDARRGDFADLYITFASAVGMTANRYSKTINEYLNVYLSGLTKERIGIIVLDYFEQPRKLVSNVIKMNDRMSDRMSDRRPSSKRSAKKLPSPGSGLPL